MFKPIAISADTFRSAEQRPAHDTAGNVFKVLHGFYGNLFLSKFASGQTGDDGADMGVNSAKAIWNHGLRAFDAATVKTALAQCMERHPDFPPNLPQFVALCAANKPRETYKPATPALEMGQKLKSAYSARAREINEKHARKAVDDKTGYIALPESLQGLKSAIANAVATAGGDEVATLRRLDAMLAPKGVAA